MTAIVTKPVWQQADEYMDERTGTFDQHAVRYRHTARWLSENGLSDDDTLLDVGAGMTELDYVLRAEHGWRGRYIPLDAGVGDIDLETWVPYRPVEWAVGLEVVEHMRDPDRLLRMMLSCARRGVAVSVPDPRSVDVLAIDETHRSLPDVALFERHGFAVSSQTFYGGYYSNGEPDNLFATVLKEGLSCTSLPEGVDHGE